MIKGIHHIQITVPTGAETAARAFYCDILQLEEIDKPASLAGRGGFWLQIGTQEIHIGTEKDVDRHGTKAHIAYQVSGLTQWRSKLTAAGISPIDSIPIPGYNRFECRDPFGNRIEFIEGL